MKSMINKYLSIFQNLLFLLFLEFMVLKMKIKISYFNNFKIRQKLIFCVDICITSSLERQSSNFVIRSNLNDYSQILVSYESVARTQCKKVNITTCEEASGIKLSSQEPVLDAIAC